MKRSSCVLAVAIVVGGLALPASGADPKTPGDFVTQKAPAIVSMKAVIQMTSEGSTQESEIDGNGAIIDPSGLVMVSLQGHGNEIGGSIEISSIKVTLPEENKDYDAFLALKDSKQDLGFIQIEGLGDRKLPCISFDKPATPSIGDAVVVVTRFGKGYAHAPLVSSGRVTGHITNPQSAFSLERVSATQGLPVFSAKGEVLGVYLPVAPLAAEEGGKDAGMVDVGNGIKIRINMGGSTGQSFLVPAEAVARSIAEAKKTAAQMLAERAKGK